MFRLPTSVRQPLGALVIDHAAPELTESDAQEVIAGFNAPQNLIKQAAKLIGVVTKQHPTLFVAACRYLQTLDWKLEGQALTGLFQGLLRC